MHDEAETVRAMLAAVHMSCAFLRLDPEQSNRLLHGMIRNIGALVDEGEYIEALGALNTVQAGLYAAGDPRAV